MGQPAPGQPGHLSKCLEYLLTEAFQTNGAPQANMSRSPEGDTISNSTNVHPQMCTSRPVQRTTSHPKLSQPLHACGNYLAQKNFLNLCLRLWIAQSRCSQDRHPAFTQLPNQTSIHMPRSLTSKQNSQNINSQVAPVLEWLCTDLQDLPQHLHMKDFIRIGHSGSPHGLQIIPNGKRDPGRP